MKTLLTLLTAVVLSITATADSLYEYSLFQTNWQSFTNYVECYIGSSNNDLIVTFPRGIYMIGTVSSNRFDSVIHDGKTISTTFVESNAVLNIMVMWQTNVSAITNTTIIKRANLPPATYIDRVVSPHHN